MTEEHSKIFNDSLTRCFANEQFLNSFYDRFLEADDEIKAKFANTNFEQQNKMFEKSLYDIISVSESNNASEQALISLAHKHKDMGIKQEHYQIWQECLLQTVSEVDQHYNEDVRHAWEHVLKRGIDFMTPD